MDTKEKVLIGFIICIIAAVLILVMFDKVKTFSSEQTSKEICKRQVQINAYSSSLQANINCPINYITIKSPPNSDGTKRRLAELMNDVRDIYDKAWTGSVIFPAKSGTFCAVYAIVDFSQKGQYIDDFDKFLIDNRPTYLSDQSYMDYFTTGIAGTSKAFSSKIAPSKIPTSDKYAIIFKYSKTYQDFESFTNKIGAFASGQGVGGLPVPQAGIAGKSIVVIGGGIVAGVATAAVLYTASVPLGIVFLGLTAGGMVTGSTLTSVGILAADNAQVLTPSVLLITYNGESELKDLGCEYLPVSAGTRPQ